MMRSRADRKAPGTRRTAIRVGGAVLGLAVLAAGGVGVARALTRPADPNATLRTAVVSRGTVQQVLPLTGTVQRVEQVKATFPVAGTITAVNVAVGDRVQQGQVLASMDPLPLQATLLDARAQLAQAQAQLDDEENPTGTPGRTAAAGENSRPSAPAPNPGPSRQPVPESVARLPAAMTAVHEALSAQQTACRAVLGPSATPQAHPITVGSPTASPPHTPTPSTSPTPTATPSPIPSGTPAPTPTPSAGPSRTAAPSGPPTRDPLPPPSGPNPAQLAACTDALRQLAAAEQQAASLISQAASAQQAAAQAQAQQQAQQAARQQPAGQLPAGQLPAGAPPVDEAKVASDRASVLAAQQAVAQAQSNLDAATLTAPIAGTVAAVGFTAGTAATPITAITVIGAGAAEVTVPVPLTNRPQLRLGQQVRVYAPGSLTADPGTITEIAPLPVNASASTPSYNATVLVADPGPGLASGGRADTGIVVGQVADAVTVPVSALTRVATGTGTVRLVEATGTREVSVGTGLVGNGLIEITSGLTAGQRVVLADSAQPLPTLQLRNLRSGQGGGQSGGQQTPGAQPS